MPTTVILNADSGAGRAIVERFAEDGHAVVGIDESAAGRSSIRETLRTAAPGGIDILVNNAPDLPWAPVSRSSVELFAASIDRGFNAVFSACREAAILALESGSSLRIVNVVSVLGEAAVSGSASVACASSAVIAASKAFAGEWGTYGFRVSTVMVGPSGSDGGVTDGGDGPGLADFPGYRPLQDPLTPADVASAVAFVASDQARAETGQALIVDAGWLAYGWHRGGP